MALQYRERFGEMPPKEIFSEHFMLFATRQEASENKVFRAKMELLEGYEESVAYMDQNPPQFPDYEAFLRACYQDAT